MGSYSSFQSSRGLSSLALASLSRAPEHCTGLRGGSTRIRRHCVPVFRKTVDSVRDLVLSDQQGLSECFLHSQRKPAFEGCTGVSPGDRVTGVAPSWGD